MKKLFALALVFLTFSVFLPVHAYPAAPVLQLPGNGTTIQSRYVTFMWNSVPTAVIYELQYSTNSSFSYGNYTTISNLTDISYSVTLSNCTTYWWRVRASDQSSSYYYSGGWGNYSTIFSFRIEEQASQPTLSAPDVDAEVTSKRPTLYWTGTSGSIFNIQVATDSGFSSLIARTMVLLACQCENFWLWYHWLLFRNT
jgi:hypothetical protein